MEPESRKRRASNFDVSPEQLSAPSLISSFLTQQKSSILKFGSDGIYSLDNFVGEGGSVIDPVFILRLERALERNFDYIIRKDSQIEEAKVNLANYSAHHMKQHALLSAASVSAAAGIGAAKLIAQMNQQMAKQQQESVSVYVSNLPLDITEEELEILFGTVSSVAPGPRVKQPVKPLKRIRLYTDSVTGKKKGDALLTFTKPELAKNAVSRFNEMDIGDGFVIKVVRADFQQSGRSKDEEEGVTTEGENIGKEEEEDTDWDDSSLPAPAPSQPRTVSTSAVDTVRPLAELRDTSGSASSSVGLGSSSRSSSAVSSIPAAGPDPAVLHASLPPECEADSHPVVVILNLYDNASLSSFVTSFSDSSGASLEEAVSKFYEDLEADILVECCHFGRIRFLQVLDLAEEMVARWGGGLAVTFDKEEAARECAATFARRRVGGKPVTAVVLPTKSHGGPSSVENGSVGNSSTSIVGSNGPTVAGGYTPLDRLPAHIPPPPPPPRFVRPAVVTAAANTAEDVRTADGAATSVPGHTEEPAGDELDVDDFLNSLL